MNGFWHVLTNEKCDGPLQHRAIATFSVRISSERSAGLRYSLGKGCLWHSPMPSSFPMHLAALGPTEAAPLPW